MSSVTSEGGVSTEVQGLIDQQRANVDELNELKDKLSSIKAPSELAEIRQETQQIKEQIV
jgi:hypothetical protein